MLQREYTMLEASNWQCEREWADPSGQCPKPAEPDTSLPFLGCSSFHPTSHTLTLACYTSLPLERWSRTPGVKVYHLSPLSCHSPSTLSLTLLHLPVTQVYLWKGGAGLQE